MKNILIFSDGTSSDTGGRAGKLDSNLPTNESLSNVYRLYVASSSKHQNSISENDQVSFYDAGLGSSEDGDRERGLFDGITRPIYRVVSKATGYGITTNIVDCYRFLVDKYEPGDKIFLFGFSSLA